MGHSEHGIYQGCAAEGFETQEAHGQHHHTPLPTSTPNPTIHCGVLLHNHRTEEHCVPTDSRTMDTVSHRLLDNKNEQAINSLHQYQKPPVPLEKEDVREGVPRDRKENTFRSWKPSRREGVGWEGASPGRALLCFSIWMLSIFPL